MEGSTRLLAHPLFETRGFLCVRSGLGAWRFLQGGLDADVDSLLQQLEAEKPKKELSSMATLGSSGYFWLKETHKNESLTF